MAPGFRFDPTDEELVSYYLKRKVQGKPMAVDLIKEVDIYKQEDPSHLPAHSKMKTKDGECFFFTTLEKRGKSGYIKRATTNGYWRKRGEATKIKRGGDDGQVIGKFWKLVFYTGRSPNSRLTNWVIHEYHLVDNDGNGLETDAYVLCRLSQIRGNINAPFSEQEWDDDGRALVPSPVLANRINEKIQQESDFGIKNLFDLNELPSEFEMDDDPETVNNDACVLNKEGSLPFVQFKRKRQIDSFGSYNNSSQTTHQDHCSSPKTTSETTIPSVAAMVGESEPEPVDTMVVPTSSYTELIKLLQKERQQIAAERKRHTLEMTNAEMTISDLVGKNNALCMEIEELKKKNSNKE